MKRRRRAGLWLLATAITVTGDLGFVLGNFSPGAFSPAADIALDATVGFVTMAAGIVTWSRRPRNRLGPMLYAAGAAWSLSGIVAYWMATTAWTFEGWGYWFVGTTYVIGTLLQPVHYTLLVHLLLAYPDGRLHSNVERFLVAVLYAGVAVNLVTVMIDPIRNAIRHFIGPPVFPFLDAIESHTLGAIGLAAFFVLARRWAKATHTARRTLTPVLGAALFLAAVEVVAAIVRAGVWSPPSEDPLIYATILAKLAVPLAFLFGLFRGTLERYKVGDLVIELGEASGTSVQEALSRTLHDPSLELAYRLPAMGEFVDASGHRVSLPSEGSSRAVTMVEREGESLAAIVHDPLLLENPSLVEAAAAAAGLAIDNERLRAEVRAQLQEVRASRIRIVEAGDAERRRVERNLHDGAQQRLVTVSLALGMLRERLDPGADRQLAADVDAIGKELREATEELRELARGIHPAILTEEGLSAAVESLVLRSSVSVSLEELTVGRLPASVEATAYFVVAEALTNISKYAHASRASVSLVMSEGSLDVEIVDDGGGGADPRSGSGLRGLDDRVSALGGQLRVESPAGGGTRVRAEIPCDGR